MQNLSFTFYLEWTGAAIPYFFKFLKLFFLIATDFYFVVVVIVAETVIVAGSNTLYCLCKD